MPIRQLSPHLVNQIAAGEVIERPASVVKELLENALDAGANRIDVAVEDGGMSLIRLADDGHGIPPEELSLALTAHATSKLTSAEQLMAIATLGFRGEALASIASVSRLRLRSRPHDREEGVEVEQAGDRRGEPRPAAMAPGTVVEVSDLFFNVPARRRFMRTAATEFGHVADAVARTAMVHPFVGFTLSHNDRRTLDLPPGQTRRQRCVALLGHDLEEALLEFEHTDDPPGSSNSAALRPAQAWGLLGEPSIARGTAKAQYLCVNGRPVKDRNLAHALKEGYRGLIAPDRQPVAVVFVDLDPSLVDVNVHPTKAEVRFRQPSAVHGLVLTQVRQRLLASDLTPALGIRDQGPGIGSTTTAPLTSGTAGLIPDPRSPTPATPSAFVDYFRQMDPKQKGFVYDEVRREMADDLLTAAGNGNGPAASEIRNPKSEIRHVLQFHNSYVVTPDESPDGEPGLLIVDQHALHERVMFEELRQRILVDGRSLESQRLLMPAVVDADGARQALLDDLGPLLEKLGVEASPLGPEAIGVQAFPSLLFDRGVEPANFVAELLDKAESGLLSGSQLDADASAGEAALHEVLDMMSCKAAVKAGDRLSDDELAALLARRDAIERGSSCPHGRPTTIRLSLRDLEKQFHRG
ncbi:MAG: DNA mismatch repair endonuclease MutL [Planctomycetota bacterium]